MSIELPTVELEYTVNGRKVWMKERLPGRDAHQLPKLLSDYSGDTDVIAQMGQIAIERWEFDGDPHSKRGYNDLDVFDDLLPLGKALTQYVLARLDRSRAIEENLKN